MTQRERRLATIVGGGLVVLAAWQLVKWTAIDPIQSLRERITAARVRHDALDLEALRLNKVTRDWGERTARTLSDSRADARRVFRSEIDRLAQQHGLTDGIRLGDGVPQPINSEGFVALPISLRCSGSMKSVLDFLIAFYRLPYLGRITSVQLTAEGDTAPRGRGRENTPPPEPKLNVTINASTLVLPVLKDVPGQRHGEFAQVADVPRLAREADLPKLYERNLFAKWTPKPPPPVEPTRPTTPRDGGRRSTPPPTQPPPDPRRDAQNYRLAICEALRGVPSATVYDTSKPEQPPAEYKVDDAVDDGTVVLIQPRGMVVRVQEEQDGASRTAYYFYEIGTTFKDRAAITPESHPELAARLNLAAAQ